MSAAPDESTRRQSPMAQVTFKGTPIHTNGELPAVGAKAPDFKLTGGDLKDVSLADYKGKKKIGQEPDYTTRRSRPPDRSAAQRSPRRLAARISSERAGSAAATARASTSAPTSSLSICSARSRRERARLPRDGLCAR